MAIAFDAVSATQIHNGTGSATISWSHTCTGDNGLLIVGISGTGPSGAAPTVTAITYNSVAMTSVGVADNGSGWGHIHIYYLKAPATGANTVSITFDSSNYSLECASISFTGVDQTTPLGTFVGATGNSGTASTTVSSASGEVVVAAVSVDNSPTITIGGSATQRWNGTSTIPNRGAGSTDNGAASVTMSWTFSSNLWAIGAVPLKAYVATSYTTTVDMGTFVLTGNTITPAAHYSLVAAEGPYALVGTTLTFYVVYGILAAKGIYTLSGGALTPAAVLHTSMESGIYAVTAGELFRGFPLSVENGIYTLQGSDLTSRILEDLFSGAYTILGKNIFTDFPQFELLTAIPLPVLVTANILHYLFQTTITQDLVTATIAVDDPILATIEG